MIQLDTPTTAKIISADYEGIELSYTGVSIDTRSLQAGNLYIAISGGNLDGHDYLKQAKDAGAVAAIVAKKMDVALPQLVVTDTTLAMGLLAKYWRSQFSIPVVGITGSCGKTTTTRMVAAILQQQGITLFPKGNQNNQWGVPLTLFNLNSQHEFAVIEMGADRPGEIRYLAEIVQADIAVLTNVAPVHLEVSEGIGFGTLQGVYSEKSEIFRALGKEGIAIVNAEDQFFSRWQALLAKQSMVSFGYHLPAMVRATNLTANANFQYAFDLVSSQDAISVELSSLGKHNVLNALAASAVGIALNIELAKIQQGLANVQVVSRRMIKHRLPSGALLIDDSYNSNLTSAKAVLDMLAEHDGTTIAVLGDMAEIGAESSAHHSEVGEYAKQLGIDYLYAFGPESVAMANAFGDNAFHYTQACQLISALQARLPDDALLMVKGSLSTGMDRIVNALLAQGN